MISCSHTRYTFPQTLVERDGTGRIISRHGMYVTCLDCLEKLPYDWEKMKVMSRRQAKGLASSGKLKMAA
jgi:hypothetical protein